MSLLTSNMSCSNILKWSLKIVKGEQHRWQIIVNKSYCVWQQFLLSAIIVGIYKGVSYFHISLSIYRYEYLSEENGMIGLQIEDVDETDAGEYACVATNRNGRATFQCQVVVNSGK